MVSSAAREYTQTVDPTPVIIPVVHENPKPTVSGEAPVVIPVDNIPITPEIITPPTHTSADISTLPDTQVST